MGDQERLRVSVAKVRTNVLFELKLKINVCQCLRIGIKGYKMLVPFQTQIFKYKSAKQLTGA